jgi:hypothetical protein
MIHRPRDQNHTEETSVPREKTDPNAFFGTLGILLGLGINALIAKFYYDNGLEEFIIWMIIHCVFYFPLLSYSVFLKAKQDEDSDQSQNQNQMEIATDVKMDQNA